METPDSFGPLTPLLSKYFIIHEKQIDLERERKKETKTKKNSRATDQNEKTQTPWTLNRNHPSRRERERERPLKAFVHAKNRGPGIDQRQPADRSRNRLGEATFERGWKGRETGDDDRRGRGSKKGARGAKGGLR